MAVIVNLRQGNSDHRLGFKFDRWHASARIPDVEEIEALPYLPRSTPCVEDLFRTPDRELNDRILFRSGNGLERKLEPSHHHGNNCRARVLVSTDKSVVTGGGAARRRLDRAANCSQTHCLGFYELPLAARVSIRQPHVCSSRTRRSSASLA